MASRSTCFVLTANLRKISGLENRFVVFRFVTKRYGEIGLQNAGSKNRGFFDSGFYIRSVV